jgi:hypothetical protein
MPEGGEVEAYERAGRSKAFPGHLESDPKYKDDPTLEGIFGGQRPREILLY